MLFSDRLVFIHTPKAAGSSVTKFLMDNITGRITLVVPSDRPDPSISVPLLARVKANVKATLTGLKKTVLRRVAIVEGPPHEHLGQAARRLAGLGHRLEDFDSIISVMRNPYDMEVSRYHFLRRGYLGVAGLSQGRAQQIAFADDFAGFARKAPYLGRLPARIENWYEIDGKMPQNLRILRFESLEHDLERIVSPLYPIRRKLERLNVSPHEPYTAYLTAESEEAIYRKYQWLFDREFYKREQFPDVAAIHSAEYREHV